MPFKSKAQQRFMFSQHPEMAKRWAEHTPDIKSLPEKVDSDSNEKKSFVTASELGRFTAFAEKRAALDPAVANALGFGGVGALLGGGLGALTGFRDPGHYDAPDEQGYLRRHRGNRLLGALRLGLSGAVAGGLGGAALGGLGTEAVRLLPPTALQHKIDMLNKEEPTDFGQRLHRDAQIRVAEAAKRHFNSLDRDQQHALMRSNSDPLKGLVSVNPIVYDNPLSRRANIAADYFNDTASWLNKALSKK